MDRALPVPVVVAAAAVLALPAWLQGEPPDAGDRPQRHGGGRHRLHDFAGTALRHGRRHYRANPDGEGASDLVGWSGIRSVTDSGRSGPNASRKMWSPTHPGELNRSSSATRRNRSRSGNHAGSAPRIAVCMSVSTSPGETAYADRSWRASSSATTRVS